jgi:hypothetical protein
MRGEIVKAAKAAAKLITTRVEFPDLAREDAEAREASVGEEADQKEQVVNIRRYERAG